MGTKWNGIANAIGFGSGPARGRKMPPTPIEWDDGVALAFDDDQIIEI